MSGAEVVTFQIGSFSNFIGAHFWNIQQEQSNCDAVLLQKQQQDESVLTSGIRSSALWSEHEVKRHTNYRPRLIAVDLQGALGGAHAELEETIENQQPSSICWEGKISRLDPHGYASLSKHPFIRSLEDEITTQIASINHHHQSNQSNAQSNSQQQSSSHRRFDFSSTVKYFSDYFIPDWDPHRHMSFVPDYFYETDKFDSFAEGLQLTQSEDSGSFWDSLTDKFRNQFELCDQLGAVHLLVDWETGFGGIGAGVVQWLAEHAPKTSVLVYGNQPYEETMAEKSSDWTGPYRRVGGSLFFQSCIEELSHDWNSFIFSDFNLASLDSIPKQSHRLALGQLDWRSRYESSAMPALATNLLSMPYRLEGATVSAARALFESVNLNNILKPLMSLHLSCPISSDLLSLQSSSQDQSSSESLSMIERLWDVSTTPLSQPARIQIDPHCDIPSLTQYTMGCGLTHDQEISLVSQLLVKDRYLLHPDAIPIPITFPQFSKDSNSPELTEASSLACLRPMTRPTSSKVFSHLRDCVDRVIKVGRSATLESHGGIERASLLDVSHRFMELFHSEDSPLDFD